MAQIENPNGWWGPPKSESEMWNFQRRNTLITISSELARGLIDGATCAHEVKAKIAVAFAAAEEILRLADNAVPRA